MGRKEKIIIFALVAAFSCSESFGMGNKPAAAAKKPAPKVVATINMAAPVAPAPKMLTLQDCYLLSLKRSETLAITKEEIERAKAQFFAATATILGDVDFNYIDFIQEKQRGFSSADQQKSGVQGTLNDPERATSYFSVQQPLFQGFKSLAAFKAAGSLKEQRKDQYIRAKQLLFEDVADSLFLLLYRRKEIAIINGIHKLLEDRIKELQERVNVGRSRESEVVNVQSKMKVLEADLAQAQGALLLSKYQLEFLTGIPIDPELIQDDDTDVNESKERGAYLREGAARPDVEAARHSINLAWSNIIAAQSGLWPLVTMQTNRYTHREGFQAGIDWDLTFNVDVPLFSGGENIGKLKDTVAQWKQAKLRYSEAQRRAVLEIQQSYSNWETTLKQSRALDEAVMAADENFRLQTQDYSYSLVSNLDVLDALEQLNNTQRSSNQARYQVKQFFWRLRVAAGEIK